MTTSVATRPEQPRTPKTAHERVILLEFNELSPALIERFMDEGHLPNFRRLYDESHIFVSDAEEVAPNLEPWIQWVTVHCGQSYDEHGIYHLGDGHKLKTKQVWDLLSDAGYRVWVCGSMNARYDAPINGAVLPDPWAAGTMPYPSGAFESYFTFVQRNVQEYTNDRVPLSKSDYRRFLSFMLSHGMSYRTLSQIVGQLTGEKLGSKHSWKRATLLDRLQFDVFRWYLKRNRPDFSTFFLNSTAHFQHMHWRNMDPEPFKLKPTTDEQREYQHAIRYGYEMMDRIVGETLDAATPDTTVILASALSQQPCLIYEDIGGKTFYRPRQFERVLEYAGVTAPYRVAPVMSEQFHVHFDNEGDAKDAAAKLRALMVDGGPAMFVEEKGSSVFAGCGIFRQLAHDVPLSRSGSGETFPFFRLFYQVEGIKSGMHHPDGILWIRRPDHRHEVHEGKVPLRNVAPTLMHLFGLEPQPYMSGELLPV